jgi:hypothetical protein
MTVKVEPVVGVKDYYTLTVTDQFSKVTILTLERSEMRHIIQSLDNAI